jgi:hypothetical protein
MLPDFERVCCDWLVLGNPATRAFGELLIDCEEDRTLRAGLVGNAAGGREVIAARAGGPHTSGGRGRYRLGFRLVLPALVRWR